MASVTKLPIMASKEKKPKGKGHLRPKALITDDSIMGTNNSSIVSKRSVERLYYPNEPHFFRYFVKKPQRRAPLINRGYWLRMKAIDHVVRRFLEEKSEKKKVVINLGAGYDPLPWQCWTRYTEASKNVKFVDIDYKDLQERKRAMVKGTPELNTMLENLSYPTDGDVLLRSDQYLQVACDLRDLARLEKILSSEFDLENTIVFCTAEVSIAYMDVSSSDALIKFIGGLPQSRFCLLEQLIPQGPDHPFAKTMLAHFDKLGTKIRPCLAYSTTKLQEKRYRDAGWSSVRARNLWELWASDDFLTPEERIAVDAVEPFDEWEEFALFGCHYLLLVADTDGTEPETPAPETKSRFPSHKPEAKLHISDISKNNGIRRFAAPLSLRGPAGQPDAIGNFGGHGLNNRLDTINVFAHSSSDTSSNGLYFSTPITEGPSARMCHTLTNIGEAGALLVGGRSSPDSALADCWFYNKLANTWERVDDLPVPMYRHFAVRVEDSSVLVGMGKNDSKTIVSDCFVWSRQTGWKKCRVVGNSEQPVVFGALALPLAVLECHNAQGILAGGITADGRVSQIAVRWRLLLEGFWNGVDPALVWGTAGQPADTTSSELFRFGAVSAMIKEHHCVVGGIAANDMVPEDEEIYLVGHLSLITSNEGRTSTTWMNVEPCSARPLLVGHSVASTPDGPVIMAGGAVCFSMGTFNNKATYTLKLAESEDQTHGGFFEYKTTLEVKPEALRSDAGAGAAGPQTVNASVTVPRRKITSAAEFAGIIAAGQPVIMEDLNLGQCVDRWTDEYLIDRIGADRQIVVHQAQTDRMDFVSKNFSYETKTFGDFLNSVNAGGKLYLRSLAADKPAEQPADIVGDFPDIAADFQIPPELKTVEENKHSCPLRVSGPVNMWLHYDVMANILCQIRSTKRLLLFPPSDVPHLGFARGASSSSIDAFSSAPPGSHPHVVLMKPGDILYLPPLWLHTARPLEGVSVSVNVFFRDLKSGYAAGKDVYGNRDLAAYEKGRLDIQRMGKSFDGCSEEVRKFYLLRLADELRGKAI